MKNVLRATKRRKCKCGAPVRKSKRPQRNCLACHAESCRRTRKAQMARLRKGLRAIAEFTSPEARESAPASDGLLASIHLTAINALRRANARKP